ncbi:MAG: T9SS type A sorting domain-containing protein, partial [Bacteroidetes bacterium]|nr:T9SS type A sorting domain-containing protein [Bacteroidota bacterium]
MRDTAFTIHNLGTAADSAYLTIQYRNLEPHSAVAVSPEAIEIGPRDSLEVSFLFFPSQIVRTTFSVYTPSVLIDSRFTEGAPRFEKPFRFRLVDVVSVEPHENSAPTDYGLELNYPNPFNPSTTFEFSLPNPGDVRLTVVDVLGNTIATLVAGRYDIGRYRVRWDAKGIASGVYFYRLQAGEFMKTRRLLLLR